MMEFFESSAVEPFLASELMDNVGMDDTYMSEYEEGLFEEGVEYAHQGMDGVSLEPEICYDVPDCEVAMVTGEPFGNANKMDFNQGDNPYNAAGNCGLVSISNLLRRAGMEISEDDVTKFAIDSGLCDYNPVGDASGNGGTTIEMRREILSRYGIDSEIYPSNAGGSLENIADAIDSGRGVLISVNAGELWDCDDGSTPFMGQAVSNHCVTVTGIARDAATGEIKGVYIADSGRGMEGDACRYLSAEKFNEVYTDVNGTGANITSQPIMS